MKQKIYDLNIFYINIIFYCIFSCSFLTFSCSVSSAQPASSGARSHVREVPAQIRQQFISGISAEKFVEITGTVPRSLERFLAGDALMIVELNSPPVAVYKKMEPDLRRKTGFESREAYQQHLVQVQKSVSSRLRSLEVSVLSGYTIVYNGFLARIPYCRLQAVRSISNVRAVHPAPVHEPNLAASVPLIRASEAWKGLGVDGDGMVVAIIDTGVDYTHAALGGSGDPLHYSEINPSAEATGLFPSDKLIGGHDFAGTLYDAGCSPEDEAAGLCTTIPQPDANPLDENGHGTHVAAIAAGMETKELAPGVSPGAKLMALKIFGKNGSTALTLDALEWAADHYLAHGYPHIINMSLGSPFGSGSDPSIEAANNAADLGIIVIATAGNSGDTHYISGSPGTATQVVSVAATSSGYATGPTISCDGFGPVVYGPADFDGNTGNFNEGVSAPLSYAGAMDGASDDCLCTTAGFATDSLAGQVALIQRGGCSYTEKVNNAAALGAVAAIVYNHEEGGNLRGAMTGSAVDIPAGLISRNDGLLLAGYHGQTIHVTAVYDVQTLADPYAPADYLGSFSSRGPRGTDSMLKPDIAAPGVGIHAAKMASGTRGISFNGTSMAAPHVAGAAALIAQRQPDLTPQQVKALMMNTASFLADESVIPHSGAGRLDVYRAIESDIAVCGDQDLASVNWGVVQSSLNQVQKSRQLTVYNNGTAARTFDINVMPHPESRTAGMSFSHPARISVAADSAQAFSIRLTLNMTEILSEYYTLEEYFGWIVLTPLDGPGPLRLPYYFQPKPFTCLAIETQSGISEVETDLAEIRIAHAGPVPSSLWLYPALIRTRTRDASMGGTADIRMFGLGYGWNDSTYGDILEIGFNTWGPWHVPQTQFVEFDLYLDSDRDGVMDYVNFNFDYGRFSGSNADNLWLVLQADLTTGMIYLASPFMIFADYNTACMEWYLPVDWQDLGPSDSDFGYQLLAFDSGIQVWPLKSFDYCHMPFGWAIDNYTPGSEEPLATAGIRINDLDGYALSRPAGAMLMDYMGDTASSRCGQANFVPIERLFVDESGMPFDSTVLETGQTFYFNVGFSLDPYSVKVFSGSNQTPVSGLITQAGQNRYAFKSDAPGSYKIQTVSTSGDPTSLDVFVKTDKVCLPGVYMMLLED